MKHAAIVSRANSVFRALVGAAALNRSGCQGPKASAGLVEFLF